MIKSDEGGPRNGEQPDRQPWDAGSQPHHLKELSSASSKEKRRRKLGALREQCSQLTSVSRDPQPSARHILNFDPQTCMIINGC